MADGDAVAEEGAGQTPRWRLKLPESEVANWVSGDALRVDGEHILLPKLQRVELHELHMRLATDIEMIRDQLAKQEVEREMAGALSYEGLEWRNRARFTIHIKRKQLTAIHAEFARRKNDVSPLGVFALTAVRQLLGVDELKRVLDRARALQQAQLRQIHRKVKPPHPKRASYEAECKGKVQYEHSADAQAALDEMAARNDDKGMSVYGPCRWCDKYHLGHERSYTRKWRKRLARRMQKQ